jgi:hypothetical protein
MPQMGGQQPMGPPPGPQGAPPIDQLLAQLGG